LITGRYVLKEGDYNLGGKMKVDPEKKEINVQIQLDDDVAHGVYVNFAVVNHSENEFTLDFIYLQPQQPRGKVRSRIISSPNHTKRLMMAIQDNVRKYEEKFGEIKLGQEPPPIIGFLH
jgi:hypothetical protein